MSFRQCRVRRVTRAAAYRAGERIHDTRTGETYDYSDRQDVAYKEVVLPADLAGRPDMAWTQDRATLWNAAEHAGARCNSRLAREFLVLVPPELAPGQRIRLVRGFAQALADKYRCAVDAALHTPRPGADRRNHHAHLLMTVREVTPDGLGPRTVLELGGRESRLRGLGTTRDEYLSIRRHWAQLTNDALHRARLAVRVDHRSFAAQGIAQVSGTYGREVADTVVENCGNTLVLRCSASERGGTSEFASKLIGQREVVHTMESRTRRPTEWLATSTTSEQVRIEPAVMASEIERLPDLSGFLKLASRPDWQHVLLTPLHYPVVSRNREPHAAPSSPAPLAPVSPVPATAPTAASTAAPPAPAADSRPPLRKGPARAAPRKRKANTAIPASAPSAQVAGAIVTTSSPGGSDAGSDGSAVVKPVVEPRGGAELRD